MTTRIKICGIKREDEVEIINGFKVSYAGFIFAKSKRQVTIEMCNHLAKDLRSDIQKVGVFVNAPIEEVLDVIKKCQLDVIQLHGEENVDYIQQIPIEVWKTIPVKDQKSLDLIQTYEDHVDGILFETYHETLKGGTGKTFDWALLKELSSTPYKRILAGGIQPENAFEAISLVEPDILDVNSGLEVDGYKNLDKVKKLFKELKL